MKSLELLVSIEPFMTMTAQLSDYILPPTLQYERPDLPLFIYETLVSIEPYTRFTPAVARPPEGAEVQDDWTWFWELAKRLGVTLEHFGEPLDMAQRPGTEDLLAISARFSPLPFERIRAAPRGLYLEDLPQVVEPGDPDSPHRFTLMPSDVAAELAAVAAEADATGSNTAYSGFRYRLASRRMRDALNSACKELPSVKARVPTNPAFINPQDMAREGIEEGQLLRITSDAGEIVVPAKADPDLRPGVISVAHGYGVLPGEPEDPFGRGASTNRLIGVKGPRESINAMPRMSAIPVNITLYG
jgi:anaerobic selenocysteine-containing dehydrogenase